VIVTDSGFLQPLLRSTVTMIRIDAKKISQLPNENFYAGLATLKGINILDNSLFYKSIHLRGFSFTYNEGDLQLLDGMDNLPPGQGFGIGNLDGAPDIDIDNIEIIPGAASAIYGANAFNGLINVSTKFL
jgi:outer membrane receptor protein involved in Fe transport